MRYLALAAFTAAALAGAPVLAQNLDELTVTGHGSRAQSLSQAVSYADLDLTRHADRETLQRRISDTAGKLCNALNQEPASNHNIGKSCKDIAIRGARDQVRQAFADASTSLAYARTYGEPASAIVSDPSDPDFVAASPIPDTAQNRALYGGPTSRAGRRTSARGN